MKVYEARCEWYDEYTSIGLYTSSLKAKEAILKFKYNIYQQWLDDRKIYGKDWYPCCSINKYWFGVIEREVEED